MKHVLLLIMLGCANAHAGSNIVTTPTGLTFVNDGIWTKVDQSTTSILNAIKAIPPQPACDLGPVLAAIKAIPGTPTPVPTPTPTPTPTPAASGIFIGTTQYNTLVDAAGAYKPGDTVHITKNLDNDSAAFTTGDVNILCDPGVKLTWSAGYNKRPAWGKAFFVFDTARDDGVMVTQNATVKNCQMDGMILPLAQGGNAACIRVSDSMMNSLLVDGIQCTNSDNGILGAAKTTTVTNSKFWNNGISRPGYTHNVYFSTNADVVNVSGSYFGPVNQGNIFKSRAKTTNITASTFEANSTRNSSYLIDISNGGVVSVKNSVLVKGPGQAQRYILSFAPEGSVADGRGNSYEFANNIVVTDMQGAFINGAAATMNFHDNELVGSFDQVPTMTNTKAFADRASAGMQPAPAVPALPASVMSMMSVKPKKK